MSPPGGNTMHKNQPDSLPQGNEGNTAPNNGVVNATAKYRAAGIVAAAARAERDYHLATLHLQNKLAEAAERRAMNNLSASMQGPMKDDYEVAQACLNLRTDGKDGMYPMVDPNYPRMNDPTRRNGPDVPPGMPVGPMMHPPYQGHPRYFNPNAPALSMMDPHMHPLQNMQLEPLPREMHPQGHMPPGMHYMPDYHGTGLGKRKYDPSSTEGAYTKKMKSAFQGSNSSSMTSKSQETKKGKRPADMPRRPLSAYNFFFSEERERVLASLPSPDNKDESKKTDDSEDKNKETKSEDSADKPFTPKGSDASPEGSDSTPEETPEVTSEDTTKATSEETSKSTPEETLKPTTEEISKSTEETPKSITEEKTEPTPEETTKSTLEETAKSTPEGTPERNAEDTPEGTTESTTKSTESIPKTTSEDTPEGTPESSSKSIPEEASEDTSHDTSKVTPKDTLEDTIGSSEASDGTLGNSDGASEGKKASEAANGSSDNENPKSIQSNQDRLLSLRLVQNNTRRPHRKTHGKIGFKELAKLIGERWRGLSAENKIPYRKLAETDLARYKEQMEEYNRKHKWAFLQESENQPPAVK